MKSICNQHPVDIMIAMDEVYWESCVDMHQEQFIPTFQAFSKNAEDVIVGTKLHTHWEKV